MGSKNGNFIDHVMAIWEGRSGSNCTQIYPDCGKLDPDVTPVHHALGAALGAIWDKAVQYIGVTKETPEELIGGRRPQTYHDYQTNEIKK